MVIKKLSLTNFMCYYGENNDFNFSNGLNIILGHNGDGKSTIFTAMKWLFDATFGNGTEELFSKKKFSEIFNTETFTVSVEIVIEQYKCEYTISKSFTVTKNEDNPECSEIHENVFKKDLETGQKNIENITIKDLSLRVFPEEFRNFSMFETETETLNLIEGKALADLVKNFSDARHYAKIENIIENFADTADRQYRKENRADIKTQREIEKVDNDLKILKSRQSSLALQIEEDEDGISIYEDKIKSLVENLGLASEFKDIQQKIDKLKEKSNSLKRQINEDFTNYLFDDFYILIGFENIINEFSKKIDEFRMTKNNILHEERTKYAVEQLKLEGEITPLPPGSPNVNILKEFQRDNTCKICGRPLDEHASKFIQKSIDIFHEQQKEHIKPLMLKIFPNTIIEELSLLDQRFNIQTERNRYSSSQIKNEIEFLKTKNDNLKKDISDIDKDMNILLTHQNEILQKTPFEGDYLVEVGQQHMELSRWLADLKDDLQRKKLRYEKMENDIEEANIKRNKILGQAQSPSSKFKNETREILQDLLKYAKSTKDLEYGRFLDVLSQRATEYLKKINTGEIVGHIILRKKHNEVIIERYDDNKKRRDDLMDTGAIKITIPLSILFAIADIAAEIREDDESAKQGYPMIFDAPTGRLSTDREKSFFEVLKNSQKQRIVVTLRFLDTDENGIPFVDHEKLSEIPKDKCFFIMRERPMTMNDPSTINTKIKQLYS